LKKKVAIPIVASIFVFAFVIIAVFVYMISSTANLKQVNGNGNGNGNGTKFYGCTKYENTRTIHCDPIMNRQVGYVMPGHSSRIYTGTGTPIYVAGLHGLGLELIANKREGVEFANTFKLDPNKFSISIWLKATKNPQPYGSVISHYNRNSRGSVRWL